MKKKVYTHRSPQPGGRATWRRTMASQEAEREDRARPGAFAGVLWQGMDEACRYTE